MAKVISIAILVLLALVAVLRIKYLVIRKKSLKNKDNAPVVERNYMCDNCETGKKSYELDSHSDNCPYIASWKGEECRFFKAIEDEKSGCTENK